MAKSTSPSRIMERLEPLLGPANFKFRRSKNSYFRRTPYGFNEIAMTGCSPSRGVAQSKIPLYEGHVTLSLRHDNIQELMIPLKLHHSDKNDRNRPTVCRTVNTQFHPFNEHRDKIFIISHTATEDDENFASMQILEMLSCDGLDWFEKYSNIENIEREINSPPAFDTHSLFNNSEGRSYSGIAVASYLRDAKYAKFVTDQYIASSENCIGLDDWTRRRFLRNAPLITHGSQT